MRAARPERAVPGQTGAGPLDLQQYAHLATYAAMATVLFVVERLIPNPLPWVRLGLANGVILVVLFRHGALAALWVQLARLILGAVFAGAFLGPSFLLALMGGLGGWLVMATAKRLLGRRLSLLGISVLGATAHVVAQLLVVAWVFGAGRGIFSLLPMFLSVALISGACIGLVAQVLLLRLGALHTAAGS